jgi:mRNA interferase MazF
MRAVHLAKLDKVRPVVILTRDAVRPHLRNVTVAPITSTVRGLSSEVAVGPANGLDHDSVISCDNVVTVPADRVLGWIGYLLPAQEVLLSNAISYAFDLE